MWTPPAKKLFATPKPLVCSSEPNWISIQRGRFVIAQNALATHGDIRWMYTPIVRGRDDDEAYFGEATAFKDGDFIISDAFRVICNASDGSLYKNTHSSVMLNPGIKRHQGHKTLSSTAMDLNIVIFGFDSLSQMTWLRALPKTHSYFTQELGGLVFQRYNVVGYNTRTALLAMLTGHKFSELPEVTRGIQGARYVDDFPWLFREFQHAGYVTQWGEDGCHYGAFNKVPRGFKYQPVDHYLRPFCMKIPRASITNMQSFCLGSQPRHTVMIQSILDLFNNYETKPKFSFMFMGDYSSDINNIVNLVDADVVSFLQEMNQRKWLNNTLLILMSDHELPDHVPKSSSWIPAKPYRSDTVSPRNKVHPSGGLYGTTARLDAKSGRFIIKRNEIDRNDNYGNQPACIEPSHPDLREYCYCRS